MPDRSLTPAEVLAMLAATPRRLAEMTAGLSPEQLRVARTPGEWSAVEVLAHLRACADVWGDGIATILAADQPTIRAINPRTWVKRTDYPDLEFGPSLRAFATQRADLSAVLEPLPPDAWSRSATVTGAGRPLVRTVLDYARWMVLHERPHIKQIERIARTLGG